MLSWAERMTLVLTAVAGYLPLVEIVLSILLVGAVLLQTRGAGLGGAFNDTSSTTYYKRRGAEQFLFRATIVLGVLFVLVSLLALVVR
jgi:protein translocase SecG subunit